MGCGRVRGEPEEGTGETECPPISLTLGCSGRLLRLLVAYVRLLSVTATTDSVTI
jgi:hypothetical protein